MSQTNWDKAGVIISFIGSVFLPLSIFYMSNEMTKSDKESSDKRIHAEQENAQSAIQATHLLSLIQPLSSENPETQRVAIRVSEYLVGMHQIPPDFLQVMAKFARFTKSSENSLIAAEIVGKAAASDPKLSALVEATYKDSPATLYIQIPKESLRAEATKITNALNVSPLKISIPGTELRPGPDANELRYFNAKEKTVAENIQAELKKTRVETKLVDLSAQYQHIAPNHFELWFGTKPSR